MIVTLTRFTTAYWIAFGPHGPRALPPPGEGKKVALYTVVGVGVSLAIFATMRMFAKPAPHTMTREWQEASNEYLKVRTLSTTKPKCYRAVTNTYHYRAKDPSRSLLTLPRVILARV